MVKHLVLQKKGRHFLLIEYPDRYHIVTVNKRLEVDTEEWILASVCPESFFDDAGLTRETIPKRELRGVAVGGNTAGNVIALYRGKNKYQFVLSDDYEQAYIDEMFEGFERFQPPKSVYSKKNNADWRKELQDESMVTLMRAIGICLNIAGVSSFVLTVFLGRQEPFCIFVSLAVSVVAIAMYLVFPQYYSIMGSKEYKKAGYTAHVTHLEFSIMAPLLAVVLSSTYVFTVLDWTAVLISVVVISVLVLILLYSFSRELRKHLDLFFAVALVTLFISFGIVEQVNHLMNFSPELPQTCVVTGTEHNRSSKGRDSYNCTVMLEDGSEVELPIIRAEYNQLQAGDKALVYVGTGALGIEYAYFVDICE